MGTELVRACIKEENMENPSVPPGFESLGSFTLKRVRDKETVTTSSDSASVSESQTMMKTELEYDDDETITRSLKRRPWINYNSFNGNSGDEFDSKQVRGCTDCGNCQKVRGCTDCGNCQKVIARWRQEEACRPDLEAVPVFYPSEEEFKDTLNYIASIRHSAEKYGICRIIPPLAWKPPCPLKEKKMWEKAKFSTRIQRVDKLQNRDSVKKMSNTYNTRSKRRCTKYGVDDDNNSESGEAGSLVEEGFGFEPGPEFSLDTFQKYANDFKLQYFRKNEASADISEFQEQWEPTVEDIEGEYWRMVEEPSEEVEVLYGADIETGSFGSGFPKLCDQGGSVQEEKYVKSGWNLNNLPRLSGSVLSYESSDISGVLVPWLYIGMCFSSFCWHVEDHHLYSMNYLHWGAPKIWYGVPGEDAVRLEDAMRKHLPRLFDEQPDLLHKLVTQLSPSILKSEGVPVYRCVQNPGEFVLTFPRAYHSGFNCGFNCAEAVNVAPVDWLPHGQNAIELYREQGRKTSISHDKLLLGAANAAVKAQWELDLLKENTPDKLRWKMVCGQDGLLSKAFKHRIETERVRTEFLWNFSHAVKMESDFDSTSERECVVCLFDLHLFAVGCRCSPDRYTCLYHAKQLCSCPWSAKSCLYRYSIDELNILAEALEGKLSRIHRWAKSELGLELSSYISKDRRPIGNLSDSSKRSTTGEMSSQPSVSSLQDMEGNENENLDGKQLNSAKVADRPFLHQEEMPQQHAVVLKMATTSSTALKSSHEDKVHNCSTWIIKEETCEAKKPSFLAKDEVILLSDDEGEELSVSLPLEGAKERVSGSSPLSEKTHDGSLILTNSTIIRAVKCEKDSNTGGNEIPNSENSAMTGSSPSRRSPDFIKNNVKDFRQKGPRIAKVVRRINNHVEPLDYGVVFSGKQWCDNRAIFPKGFRSRVKYISVLDPTNMCNYISEVLDTGRDGPLFMVSVEHYPSEVFVHVSATKCWEMVRERVNQEISKQHKLGTKKLPPLQAPGSLDGNDMFGFSSPAIMQVIQKMDRDRVCIEYWKSRPLLQFPQHPQPEGHSKKLIPKTETDDDRNGAVTALNGLFKKANLEELQVLRTIVNDDKPTTAREVIAKLLHQEILKRRR